MSLINDALKRAAADKPRGAQSAEVPPLQPVEAAAKPATSPLLLGGVLLLAVGMIAIAAALWFGGRSKNVETAQPSPSPAATLPSASPAEASPAPAVIPPTNDSPALAANATASVAPEPTRPQALSKPAVTSSNSKVVTTTPKAVAQVKPVATTANQQTSAAVQKPVRLQSIFYRLRSPTVIINGKTLGVGDTVDGIKVVSIQRTSVEIVQNGKYRTLTLQD
ncbi:MAG: hypothetical protein ACXW3Z_07500 [Limisphaerales bacterium]